MKILFLCTGNTCRSPMAQAIFDKKAKEREVCILSDSAGISAFTGDRASEMAVEVMKERKIDLSSHRSRRFSEYMADEYDYFVCMTEEQSDAIAPFVSKERIILGQQQIWDPGDDGIEIYRLCADKMEREAEVLLDFLTEVRITPMKSEDVSAVAEIERECFSEPWSEKGLSDELTNENAVFFVAKILDETVGYMGMHTVLDECYVANVAVRANCRRKGIGRKLLRYAEKKARERSCSFISLEVRASNESAIGLYSSESYEKMGERKDFYSDPKENALIMTKTLR